MHNLKAGGVSSGRIASIVAAVGTAVATSLHVAFGLNAGALWRDEVNSLEIATMTTVAELWSNLTFDSFPALFFFVLRAIAGVPATASDVSLRVFGVVIGLLVLGALWLNARWLRLGFPLISLGLIGFNPMVIRYGDSIRAYGLGMLMVLVSLGMMWRLAERATPIRAVAALLSAVLSVQCLYYNSFLLFAVCLGASAVALRRRAYGLVALIFGIGGVAAASLLIYLPTIQKVESTNFFWRTNFTVSLFWRKLSETLGAPLPAGAWLWVVLFGSTLIAGGYFLIHQRGEKSAAYDRFLFGLVSLVVGSSTYIAFLFHLSYTTQPWYYVVFIVFVASCLEIVIASLGSRELLLRSAVALLFLGMMAGPAWAALEFRQTNVDAIASQVQAMATPDDLIVINTWNYGIPFRRYFRGSTPYTTIPPIADLRSHRMDLVLQQMLSAAPLSPVLQKMEETLRNGRTVWLIGPVQFVAPGKTPLKVRKAEGNFYRAWSEEVAFLVQTHAEELVRVPMLVNAPVIHYEDLPLSAIRGWHENGALTVR